MSSHGDLTGIGARNGLDRFGASGTADCFAGGIDEIYIYDLALLAIDVGTLAMETDFWCATDIGTPGLAGSASVDNVTESMCLFYTRFDCL